MCLLLVEIEIGVDKLMLILLCGVWTPTRVFLTNSCVYGVQKIQQENTDLIKKHFIQILQFFFLLLKISF